MGEGELTQSLRPQAYRSKGLKQLYPWQAAAMESGEAGNNLVYCAPTSGGKTLVAELLMIRRLMATQAAAVRRVGRPKLVLRPPDQRLALINSRPAGGDHVHTFVDAHCRLSRRRSLCCHTLLWCARRASTYRKCSHRSGARSRATLAATMPAALLLPTCAATACLS